MDSLQHQTTRSDLREEFENIKNGSGPRSLTALYVEIENKSKVHSTLTYNWTVTTTLWIKRLDL